MLIISSENFSLKIDPLMRMVEGDGGPYFDWITCNVSLNAGEFEARIQWESMPLEIERFKHELDKMNTQLESGSIASLHGVERNFKLDLQLNDLGGLVGEYRLQANASTSPTLTGTFEIDQSYLPAMIDQLDTILHIQPS